VSEETSKKIPIQGRELSVSEHQPVDWFEELYAGADRGGEGIPWASMKTHASFAEWLGRHTLAGAGKTALVVGCGMGDDAVELESLGFDVTAFDVSKSAIRFCKERFEQSKVEFVAADLFTPPAQWSRKFDFVLEIYTVQALPPRYEDTAIERIASFVAPGGRLLVVAEVGEGPRSFDKGPPWLLTPQHVDAFAAHGLSVEERHVAERDERGMAHFVTTFRRDEG